jgi:hypothetical protein
MILSFEDERDAIAAHEAGHAVVAAVTKQRFEYVSLRPRRADAAGHVVFRTHNHLRGHWEAHTVISFAGIIAEEIHRVDRQVGVHAYGSPEHEALRRTLVRVHGRQDMHNARNLTRWAWSAHHYPLNNTWTAPGIEDGWSPADLAVRAWQRSVRIVVEYIDAIDEVAAELTDSSRALTWPHVSKIVAEVGPTEHDEEIPAEFLHPWFLDHTRLTWPPSQAWVARMELAAARNSGDEP